MIPTPPAHYRRQGRVLLILTVLPAVAVLILALTGHWTAAAILFGLVFALIGCGTILPRVRLFGPFISQLPPAAAAANSVCLTIDDGPDP
ncbi:MAG TPA: hypothetical protein VD994_21145, partial [Prosthecobacter sp.]|nr:hypothetical protein [Prosthecobacter sp.]